MRAVRLRWYLIILALALALDGCSRAPTSQSVAVHASTSNTARTTVTATPTVLPSQPSNTVTNPISLSVPAIGINALVEPVGMLSNGDMATPTRNPWEDVGWYNAGPRPGERGSAVIDGHLDRPGGFPAVFWRLRDLHVGDDVLVLLTTNGKILHFRVTRIELYTPQTAPIQDIFGNKGGTYLNLITCAGDWIPSQHQTTSRLVIYTSLA